MGSQATVALGWTVIVLLSVFTLRRLVLVAAAALPARECAGGFQPSVVVIAALRDEESDLPGLLAALDQLQYPEGKLEFVLVSDGSRDATGRILEAWAAGRREVRILQLAESRGKAAALNHALAAASETEVVAVYDADLRPHPDSLARLTAFFQDPRAGAAAGYRQPSNAAKNPITAYGALESMVHQLVTQAGKDKLGLNPTTLGGNCLYRRSALREVGGFPPDSFSEDIEVSLALAGSGWRTRFCRGAVAGCAMVESLPRFRNQRTRWTQGIYRSTRRASRLESWFVASGYFDRLVFLVALIMVATARLAPAWLALYFAAPVAAVVLALCRSRAGVRVAAKLVIWGVPMFLIDLAVTLEASVNAVLRRRPPWYTGRNQA